MKNDCDSRVAKVVWPWRDQDLPDPTEPAVRRVVRAAIQAAVGASIGGILFYYERIGFACVVWTISAIVLLSGLFVPVVFKGIERGAKALGKWVAFGLTWLLLAPFFYVVFSIGRLVLLLRGEDPMRREFPCRSESCWVPRPGVQDKGYYRRQY